MNNYYFTFGSIHYTNEGVPMKDYWVRVTARSYNTARECFIENFSDPIMGRPEAFAFQYSEKDFDPSFFVRGEFCNFETEK